MASSASVLMRLLIVVGVVSPLSRKAITLPRKRACCPSRGGAACRARRRAWCDRPVAGGRPGSAESRRPDRRLASGGRPRCGSGIGAQERPGVDPRRVPDPGVGLVFAVRGPQAVDVQRRRPERRAPGRGVEQAGEHRRDKLRGGSQSGFLGYVEDGVGERVDAGELGRFEFAVLRHVQAPKRPSSHGRPGTSGPFSCG